MTDALSRSSGPSRRRRSGGPVLLVLLVLVVAVAVAVVVELLAPAAPPQAAEPRVAQAAAASGVWYCPATAGEEESALVTVAAAGDEPSEVTLVRYTPEGPVADETVAVAPGSQVTVPLDAAAAAQPVAVRWRGGPATATWRVDGAVDAEAPCAATPSPTWHVSGLHTVGESTSTLHLFNPFTVDAVVRVVFGTPEGRQALVLTDAVVVPAGGAVPLDLDEVQPEVTDLAATVEVQSGRVVAQGEVGYAVGGRVLVPAVGRAYRESAIAQARYDSSGRSYLTVYNPADREAAVEVSVTDPRLDGTSLPAEIAVPAGGVVRVPLEGASASGRFGVAVRSLNGIGVVTTRTTSAFSEPRRTASAATAVPPSTTWSVVGGGTEGRASQLWVLNPGAEAVTVDILADGAPPEWTDLVVAPNAVAVLDLAAAGERAGVPVRVVAEAPVVAQVVSATGGEEPQLWTPLGVPERAWTGPTSRPVVRRDPLLGREPVALRTETDDGDDLGPLPEATAPPAADPTAPEPTAPEPTAPEPTAPGTTDGSDEESAPTEAPAAATEPAEG